MLKLARLPGERIFIGDDIVLKIISTDSHTVQLSLEASPHLLIESETYFLGDQDKGRPEVQANERSEG
ncbi:MULTISPECIES: carbon storage regulator [unclassified Pseudomonas]|uniref:carbon storage regulator n=1 Tax=unclassified Pseudomonas TaxID=196821 RepID=UPI0015A7E8DC|nr:MULTISPECIES: carbon storage regulator [unclassified Pseudomonas]